jgi:predicted nucleotidyltransferase
MEVVKSSALRGELLEFLKYVYPDGADGRMLVGTFYQYHKVELIKAALEYLTDKGYISKKELPHPYQLDEKLFVFKILPLGIDLMEGTIPSDLGVVVPRR